MNSEEIKKRVLERVMAPYPRNCHVVPYSTPVVSFGNPETSTVATLGINPSSGEFFDRKKNLLTLDQKRLVDLEVLGLQSEIERLTFEQADEVIKGCFQYFEQNPYMRWFSRLEEYVLSPANASYFSRVGDSLQKACHLDLIQWATNPLWGDISDKKIRETLLEKDFDFLRFQLTNYKFKKLFLNGREVIDQFKSLGLTDLTEVGKTSYQSGNGKSSLYRGKYGDTEVWGWGLNVQSKVTLSNLEDLSNWIGDDSAEFTPETLNLDEALTAFSSTRNKEYPASDISKMKAITQELGLSEFEVKAKFIRDVGDIFHIHPDMLVARKPFSGSRDRGVDPYPNYPHFFQLAGWSNKGSKPNESAGTPKVLCPVAFVRVLPEVVCDYCEEIHPKE